MSKKDTEEQVTEVQAKPSKFDVKNVSTTPQFPYLGGEQVHMLPEDIVTLPYEAYAESLAEIASFNGKVIVFRIY